MNILLAFAPFIAFAVVDRHLGAFAGLLAGAAASAALLIRNRFVLKHRELPLLEIGTLVLFAGLAVFVALGADWSILGVRLRVDAGLLAIVLATVALGRPFTLVYARRQTSPAVWTRPGFLRTNRILSLAWAGAFAVLVAADLLMLLRPDLPQVLGIGLTVAALCAAAAFTRWYPAHVRAAGAPS